jgi:hypothetical protein
MEFSYSFDKWWNMHSKQSSAWCKVCKNGMYGMPNAMLMLMIK